MADLTISGTLVTSGADDSLVWGDLADYVVEVHRHEGAQPNIKFYKTLGNQCLRIISERTELLLETSWDNESGGEVTISGGTVNLPIDCQQITGVWWENDKLDRRQAIELDDEDEDWRDLTATAPLYYVENGRSITLDIQPTGTVTGKLVIRGLGMLPSFPEADGDPNPLSYLPIRFQIIPAYYILANLPTDETNQTQVTRRNAYQAMWERDLDGLVSQIGRRKYAEFVY